MSFPSTIRKALEQRLLPLGRLRGTLVARTLATLNEKERQSPAPTSSETIATNKTQSPGKVRRLVDLLLPGRTLPKKAVITTTFGGIMAMLFSQGILHVDEELLIVAAFYLTTRVLYVKAWGPLMAMVDSGIADECHRLAQGRADQIDHLKTALTELEAFRDYGEVHEELYRIQADNIKLELELESLVERNKNLGAIKAKLDEAVRTVEERERRVRQERVETIMKGLLEKLRDKDVQERLMKKAFTDLKSLVDSGRLKIPGQASF